MRQAIMCYNKLIPYTVKEWEDNVSPMYVPKRMKQLSVHSLTLQLLTVLQ